MEVLCIHGGKSLPILGIRAAVEEGDEAIRVEIQGRHLPPEPLGAGAVGPHELRFGQLAHEQEQELLLLQIGEACPGRDRWHCPGKTAESLLVRTAEGRQSPHTKRIDHYRTSARPVWRTQRPEQPQRLPS